MVELLVPQGMPQWWPCPRGTAGWWPCPHPQHCLCPQLLRAHVDRAPQITPEFGMEMAHSLLGVLVAFLHRWAWGHGGTKGDTWGYGGTRDGHGYVGARGDRAWIWGHGYIRTADEHRNMGT